MLLIPRTFHQIWVGPDPLPAEFAGYRKTWLRHNPGWTLQLWTEENLPPDLERREVYDKLRVPAERSDILRLEVVWRFGGVYIDTDLECVRPLEGLLNDIDVFAGDSKPGQVNNAIIGAIPRHPILRRAIEELSPRAYYGYDKAAAGPVFLDTIVKKYGGVKIFEPKVFYPVSPAERAEAVAIHHSARSWKDADGFRRAALLAEQRLDAAQVQLLMVVTELEAVRELRSLDAVQTRLDDLRSKITYHRARPMARGALPTLGRRLLRKAGSLAVRLRNKGSTLRRQGWVIVTKRVWRGACVLYDMRNRPSYESRLDRVANRDEIPSVLNRRALIGRGAEIGVKKGAYSELLLQRWRGRQLVSIDPWLEDAPDAYVDHANVAQAVHEAFYQETRQRLARFQERSDIWRMTSAQAAGKVDDGTLDFVYIDARHDYDSVMEDLELWFDKVRPGGIVAGHDYVDGEFRQGRFAVKRAVDEFFGRRGLRVYSTRGRYPVEMFPSWIVEKPA